MGFGEYIFNLLICSIFGGLFLGNSAKALDEKRYFNYGSNLMASIPFVVLLVVACIKTFVN